MFRSALFTKHFFKTAEEVCGTTRPHHWRRETWWWNEHVGEVISAKLQAFKAWKTGKGTRASYYAAKRIARCAVHHDHQEADKDVYKNIDSKSSDTALQTSLEERMPML